MVGQVWLKEGKVQKKEFENAALEKGTERKITGETKRPLGYRVPSRLLPVHWVCIVMEELGARGKKLNR